MKKLNLCPKSIEAILLKMCCDFQLINSDSISDNLTQSEITDQLKKAKQNLKPTWLKNKN